MARASLGVTNITLDGATPPATNGTTGDPIEGHVVNRNNGVTTFVVVTNTSASVEYDVTFLTPGTIGQERHAIADKVEPMALSTQKWFGPFPVAVYGESLQIDVENAALKLMAFSI